jgi:hypothetical protein
MKKTCEYNCGSKAGYVNDDGKICCLSCKGIQSEVPTPEDEILDKLEEIAGLLFHLTEVMTPFVRQNIDLEDLSDCEADLLFGRCECVEDRSDPTDSSKSN